MTEERRILWLDPVGPDGAEDGFEEMLNQIASPGTRVTVRTLPRGPVHLEYRYYGALVLADLLAEIQRAEQEGFDATIIGCFYNVGLQEAREIAEEMVVAAPAESCCHLACQLGDRFSVIVGRRKWIPQMRQMIKGYGLDTRLASFRPVNLGVVELHKDPAETACRIEQQARLAVEEDGAEVILLGCTMGYGFFREVQKKLSVPVLDPAAVPLKSAELRVELRRKFGWSHSKVGAYQSPPRSERERWKLDEQYALIKRMMP